MSVSVVLPEDETMELYEIKNKILEVWAAARVIVQKFGHTKKFAKHVVAFVIKQYEKLKDAKLVEFLRKNQIGRILGYKETLDETTFSKARERMEPEILEELQLWIVKDLLKGKQLKLIVQDSTDVSAYSEKDKEAKWGHRTPSRKEQLLQKRGKEKEFFYGYKPHMIVDAETEIPIAVEVVSANTNDKKLFDSLYKKVKSIVVLQYRGKYIADAQYHASRIRTALWDDNMIPVIPYGGNGGAQRENPKDPDYGKRWAIEHVISRLKDMFGLRENRFFGLKKVKIHVFSCILAYLLRYKM